ncbi:MAG: choice-of-anchor D domain-containing protein, partial [Acidimicrobiia bacterium]|nr:choice-of-anchor D domain-containing protein [Acidimicrobiia bacterium]
MLTALVAVPFPITPAEAAGPAVSSATSVFGFPDWFEDSTGTRLDPCLDLGDAHCIVLASDTFNPLQPMVFPTNFPDEFFYNVVDSDKIPTPGCPGAADPLAANPGTALVRNALEGAFLNGAPAPSQQMVFGRIRIVVKGGLCPGQQYTFTHPYGTTVLTADEAGGIKPNAGTVDVGCIGTLPPNTCNFNAALASPVIQQGFLRWDTGADPGYLGGDPATLHTITGGIHNTFSIAQGTGVGAVAVDGASTNLFTVAGRIAGPLTAPRLTDFGGVEIGSSAVRTVRLTNVDPAATTIATLASSNPEFAVTGGSCVAGTTSLAQDASCDVAVTFTPTAGVTGLRTTNLIVAFTDGANPRPHSPMTIAVQGTSSDVGNEPLLTVTVPNGSAPPDPQTMDFGSVRVGVLSATQTVTITNTGNAPLQVTNLEFINAPTSFDSNDRDAFRILNNACAGIFVPAGGAGSCTFGVNFLALHAHPYAALLKVSANTSGGPVELNLNATGIGGVAAVSTGPDGAGPDGINPNTGFPTWYQDENGVRLGECIDPGDPLCVVLPDDFYNSAQPLVGAPNFTNFPSEYFYFVSDSDIVTTPGCGGSSPGKAFVRMATEAAFGGPTGGPVDGDQMVFGRIRFSVTSGLCAGRTYKLIYPYGEYTFQADSAGSLRRNAGTSDIGCFPVAPDVCNFAEPLASPVLGGFIKQVNAPAGYLGDPNVLSAVTGAPYLDGAGQPANYFKIIDTTDSSVVGETDQFTVMGKMVGPMMASPTALDFGTVEVGAASPEQTVTVTNDGQNPATVNGVSLVGPTGQATSDYVVTGNGCDAVTLNPVATSGDSCTITVQFTPSANGTRAATLRINHTSLNNPLSVALSGVGGAAGGEPAISVNPPTATFPGLHIGETSAAESIRVSNQGGNAPLVVDTVAIDPPGAEFTVLRDECTGVEVAPDAECVIDVAFAPTTPGDHTANLSIHSNVTASPTVLVPLSGRGSTASPLVSATNDSAGFPSYYGDNNGVRLEGCYDVGNPQDPNCVVLADAGYNPANPLSFPGNFPTEFFYALADSDLLTVPADASCGGAGGTAQLRLAVEGAFANGVPLAGQQIQFARIRYNITGLCANSSYVLVNPYRVDTLTSDGTGRIRSTVDVPNVVASQMLTQGFVRWDPNVNPQAPDGYLGDGRSFHEIAGSVFRPAGPGTDPANYFEIRSVSNQALAINYNNSTRLALTKNFLVSGRMAGPLVADRTSVDFGPQPLATTSANQTLTLTNLSPRVVDNLVVTLTGPAAGDFSLSVPPAGTCTPASALDQDQTCSVNVAFAPVGVTAGARSATLSIAYNGAGSPITVPLAGTATVPGHPEINLSRTSMAF